MEFNVFPQRPKVAKKPLCGVISVKDRIASLFDDQGHLLAELHRPEIEHMSSKGILLCGLQPDGRNRLLSQEWWCTFKTKNKEVK